MVKKTKTYRSLIAKINQHIKENSWANTPMDRWYVGVSDKSLREMSEYQRELGMDVRYHAEYYAYSTKIALQVQDHFLGKGLTKAADLCDNSENCRWVYLYMSPFLTL
ncbi:MAG: hypothetical protein J6T86_05760 [Bacteroidales bacterium]|nr:hypothetical protein [Bacteroidales bacterium]